MIFSSFSSFLLFSSSPIVSATFCCIESVTCIYVFIVKPASVCPSICEIVLMSMPCSMDRVAKLCRRSWKRICGTPARRWILCSLYVIDFGS